MNVRRGIGFALAIAMGLALGCGKTTVEGPDGKKLTIVKPADQTVARGDTNGVQVMISRGNFRDPVSIKFENLPEGIKVQDKDLKIAAGDNSATFTLKADENAALVANHEVKVIVTGPNNMQATETFKITVKDKTS